MTTRTKKLPRVPNADPPRADEIVRKSGGSDLQNGWLARHGTLSITDERLLFAPTILDRILGAKRREILLEEIEELERFPLRPEDFPPGGKRPRLLVHAGTCTYELMVGDLDAWIDAILRVYELRRQAGRDHVPAVRREGYRDMLYAEE